MKLTLQDIFEFKIFELKKKLIGFHSNSLHCKFEFFTKHLTSQDFFFYFCCVYSSLQCLLKLSKKAKTGICFNAF